MIIKLSIASDLANISIDDAINTLKDNKLSILGLTLLCGPYDDDFAIEALKHIKYPNEIQLEVLDMVFIDNVWILMNDQGDIVYSPYN